LVVGIRDNVVVQITREDLSRHYASLSDSELQALDSGELTEMALGCYRKEIEKRHLTEKRERDETVPNGDEHDELESDWLDSAATACAFQVGNPERYALEAADEACAILRAAGVPAQVVVEHEEGAPDTLNVMVPGALSLKAASILDRDLFNEELEETWRSHLAELSDRELEALRPDEICAGMLDRAARLKRVYEEAVARREQVT
jgi:hypothetical protein